MINEYISNNCLSLAIDSSLVYNIFKDFVFPFVLTLVGALVAWFVFIRQLVNDKKKDKKAKKEELKSKLTYLSILVNNAIENSKGQNHNIKKLILDMKKSNVNFISLIKHPTYDLKIIAEKIDKEDYLLSYLKFFSKKNKIERLNEFKTILDSCSIINDIFKQIDNDLESKQVFELKQKEKYSESLKNWADLFGENLVFLKEKNDPLFSALFEINKASERIKNIKSNLVFEAQYKVLLKPTLELLDKEHLSHKEFDAKTGNLWTCTSSIINIYENLERASTQMRIMLIEQNENINNLIISLEKSSEELRNKFLD